MKAHPHGDQSHPQRLGRLIRGKPLEVSQNQHRTVRDRELGDRRLERLAEIGPAQGHFRRLWRLHQRVRWRAGSNLPRRRILRQAFAAIRKSQVESLPSARKSLRPRLAERNVSCRMSLASSVLRHMREAKLWMRGP